MNFIQEKTREIDFYTSMADVARWLEIKLEDYDWHFSDVEGGWNSLNDPDWVSGELFASEIRKYDHQFIWSVISAFPKGTKPFKTEEPYADGNSSFWVGIPEKQIEESLFEIVCWDSSATLYIGLSDKLSKNLLSNAPGIKDLNEQNRKRQC